jgi:hypothetical protein
LALAALLRRSLPPSGPESASTLLSLDSGEGNSGVTDLESGVGLLGLEIEAFFLRRSLDAVDALLAFREMTWPSSVSATGVGLRDELVEPRRTLLLRRLRSLSGWWCGR